MKKRSRNVSNANSALHLHVQGANQFKDVPELASRPYNARDLRDIVQHIKRPGKGGDVYNIINVPPHSGSGDGGGGPGGGLGDGKGIPKDLKILLEGVYEYYRPGNFDDFCEMANISLEDPAKFSQAQLLKEYLNCVNVFKTVWDVTSRLFPAIPSMCAKSEKTDTMLKKLYEMITDLTRIAVKNAQDAIDITKRNEEFVRAMEQSMEKLTSGSGRPTPEISSILKEIRAMKSDHAAACSDSDAYYAEVEAELKKLNAAVAAMRSAGGGGAGGGGAGGGGAGGGGAGGGGAGGGDGEYRKMFEEEVSRYRELDVQFRNVRRSLDKVTNERDDLRINVADADSQLDALDNTIHELREELRKAKRVGPSGDRDGDPAALLVAKQEIEDLKSNLATLENTTKRLQGELKEAGRKIDRRDHDLGKANEEIEDLERRLATTGEELERTKRDLRDARIGPAGGKHPVPGGGGDAGPDSDVLAAARRENTDLREQLRRAKKQIDELREHNEKENSLSPGKDGHHKGHGEEGYKARRHGDWAMPNTVDSLKNEVKKLEEEYDELDRTYKKVLRAALDNARRVDSLGQDIEDLQSDIDELDNDNNEKYAEIGRLRGEIDKVSKDRDVWKEKVAARDRVISEAEKRENAIQQTLDKRTTERDALHTENDTLKGTVGRQINMLKLLRDNLARLRKEPPAHHPAGEGGGEGGGEDAEDAEEADGGAGGDAGAAGAPGAAWESPGGLQPPGTWLPTMTVVALQKLVDAHETYGEALRKRLSSCEDVAKAGLAAAERDCTTFKRMLQRHLVRCLDGFMEDIVHLTQQFQRMDGVDSREYEDRIYAIKSRDPTGAEVGDDSPPLTLDTFKALIGKFKEVYDVISQSRLESLSTNIRNNMQIVLGKRETVRAKCRETFVEFKRLVMEHAKFNNEDRKNFIQYTKRYVDGMGNTDPFDDIIDFQTGYLSVFRDYVIPKLTGVVNDGLHDEISVFFQNQFIVNRNMNSFLSCPENELRKRFVVSNAVLNGLISCPASSRNDFENATSILLNVDGIHGVVNGQMSPSSLADKLAESLRGGEGDGVSNIVIVGMIILYLNVRYGLSTTTPGTHEKFGGLWCRFATLETVNHFNRSLRNPDTFLSACHDFFSMMSIISNAHFAMLDSDFALNFESNLREFMRNIGEMHNDVVDGRFNSDDERDKLSRRLDLLHRGLETWSNDFGTAYKSEWSAEDRLVADVATFENRWSKFRKTSTTKLRILINGLGEAERKKLPSFVDQILKNEDDYEFESVNGEEESEEKDEEESEEKDEEESEEKDEEESEEESEKDDEDPGRGKVNGDINSSQHTQENVYRQSVLLSRHTQ